RDVVLDQRVGAIDRSEIRLGAGARSTSQRRDGAACLLQRIAGVLTAAVRVHVGNMHGQPVGEREQLLEPGNVAPALAGAAMDRAPAAHICSGFYGQRGRLWGEWIVAAEKLYS